MDTNRGRDNLDTERGIENVNSPGDTGGGGNGDPHATSDRVVTHANASTDPEAYRRREKQREIEARYRARNREKVRESKRRWKAENTETRREQDKRYKAEQIAKRIKKREPSPREIARRAGSTKYSDGKQCRNGHSSERWVSDGKCVECGRVRDKEKYYKQQGRQLPQEPREDSPKEVALKAGQSRYFDGVPCLRGHISFRRAGTGHCIECARMKLKIRRKANPDLKKRRHNRRSVQKSLRRDAKIAAATLTEITGIPHVVVETIDANGKKTFQPAPKGQRT